MLENNFCSDPIGSDISILLQQADKSVDLIQSDHATNLFVRQIRIRDNELGRITAIDSGDHFVKWNISKTSHPILPGKECMRNGWAQHLNLRSEIGIR